LENGEVRTNETGMDCVFGDDHGVRTEANPN